MSMGYFSMLSKLHLALLGEILCTLRDFDEFTNGIFSDYDKKKSLLAYSRNAHKEQKIC
jgi:hypothetical protein